jgi:hypothetical protein
LESRGTIIEGRIVHEGSTQDDLAVWGNGPSFLGASLHNLSWLSGRFSTLKTGGIERHDNEFTTLNTLTCIHTHYQWLVHAHSKPGTCAYWIGDFGIPGINLDHLSGNFENCQYCQVAKLYYTNSIKMKKTP